MQSNDFLTSGRALVQEISQTFTSGGMAMMTEDLRNKISLYYVSINQFHGEISSIDKKKQYIEVLRLLQNEYIRVLNESPCQFTESELQKNRYFILERMVVDMQRKEIQLINQNVIDALAKIIEQDNNKNTQQAIRVLMDIFLSFHANMMKLQAEQVLLESDKQLFDEILAKILNPLEKILKLCLSKMGIFKNISSFFLPEDKHMWSHFLKERPSHPSQQQQQMQQQQIMSSNPPQSQVQQQQQIAVAATQQQQSQPNLRQQQNLPLIQSMAIGASQYPQQVYIKNRYDLKVYESMASAASWGISLFMQLNCDSMVHNHSFIMQLRSIKECLRDFMRVGIEVIRDVDFDWSQSELNRKFHEELGMTHRKMVRLFQQIYKSYYTADSDSKPQISPNEFMRVMLYYTVKFPDDLVDSKILLLKELAKIIQSLQTPGILQLSSTQQAHIPPITWNSEDLKVLSNLNAFISLDTLVSQHQRMDVLVYYVKIYKAIMQFENPNESITILPNQSQLPHQQQRQILLQLQQQQQQQQNSIRGIVHMSSKLSIIDVRQLYDFLEKIIDNLIVILFDPAVLTNFHAHSLKLLVQIIQRYYFDDDKYFEGYSAQLSSIEHTQRKIAMIEHCLKFIAQKYQDIQANLMQILEFHKRNFINELNSSSNTSNNNQQQTSQINNTVSSSQQQNNIQQSNKPIKSTQQSGQQSSNNLTNPISNSRQTIPNNNPAGLKKPNNIGLSSVSPLLQKSMNIPMSQISIEEEEAQCKLFQEWVNSKRNPSANLASLARLSRRKKYDREIEDADWEKVSMEMIEKNDENSQSSIETTANVYLIEEIQAEMDGDFLQLNGWNIRDSAACYLSDILSTVIRVLIEAQICLVEGLKSVNIELKFREENPNNMNLNTNGRMPPRPQPNTSQQPVLLTKKQISILKQIFKNGIEVFSKLHGMILIHSDAQVKILSNFIIGFDYVVEENYFRDIVEPNFKSLFRFILRTFNTNSYCQCFSVFTPQPNATPKRFFSHIILKNILLLLDQEIDPFSEFYALYKTRFSDIVGKIILEVFDNIIKQPQEEPQSRQIITKSILFFVKKIHTSPYPLESLKNLKWLAHKLVMFQVQTQKTGETQEDRLKRERRRNQIQQICLIQDKQSENKIKQINVRINEIEDQINQCNKNDKQKIAELKDQLRRHTEESQRFEAVNILDNFTQLLEINVSKVKIQVAKTALGLISTSQFKEIQHKKQAAKLLFAGIQLLGHNMAIRALECMEKILRKLTQEETEYVLEGIKDEFLDKLFQIVSEYKPIDYRAADIKKYQNRQQQYQQQQQQQSQQKPQQQNQQQQNQSELYYSSNYNNFNLNDPRRGMSSTGPRSDEFSRSNNPQQQQQLNQNIYKMTCVSLRNTPENAIIAHQLLAKLCFLSKQHNPKHFVAQHEPSQEQKQRQEHMYFLFQLDQVNLGNQELQGQQNFKLDFRQTVEHVLLLFERMIRNPYDQPIRFSIIETAFSILKFCLVKFFCKIEIKQQDSKANSSDNGPDLYQKFHNNDSQAEVLFEISDYEKNLFSSQNNSSSQNFVNSNLLKRMLLTMVDLATLELLIERDNGFFMKLSKESERILVIFSKLVSASLLDIVSTSSSKPDEEDKQFQFILQNKDTTAQGIFLDSLVGSLKNQHFMERRVVGNNNNSKVSSCKVISLVWNELFLNNIYSQFKNSKDSILNVLDNFMLSALMKEIVSVEDSSRASNPKQSINLSFPANKDSLPNGSMGSCGNAWKSKETLSEKMMFDKNENALSKRFCLMECLHEFMSSVNPRTLTPHIPSIIDVAFLVSNSLPEAINLQAQKDFCQSLIEKVLKHIKKYKESFGLNSMFFRLIFQTLVSNLTSSKIISHLYSINAIQAISKIHNSNVLSVLFLSSKKPEDDVKFPEASLSALLSQAKKNKDLAENQLQEPQNEQLFQQLNGALPSKYDFTTLMQHHPSLFISQILSNINAAIFYFSNDYAHNPSHNYYSQETMPNKRILTVVNCYQTLEFLLSVEFALPFKIIKSVPNPVSSNADQNKQAAQSQQQGPSVSSSAQVLPFKLIFESFVSCLLEASKGILKQNKKESKASRIILFIKKEVQGAPLPTTTQSQQMTMQMVNQIPQQQDINGQQGTQFPPFIARPTQAAQQINQSNVQPPAYQGQQNLQPQQPQTINTYSNINSNQTTAPSTGNVQPQQPPLIRQIPPQPYPQNLSVPSQPSNDNSNTIQNPRLQQEGGPQMQGIIPGVNGVTINGQVHSGNVSAANQQKQIYINQCQLFYDSEFNLSIEDLNMNLRNWSKLLSSIAHFLKTIYLLCSNKYLKQLVESEAADKQLTESQIMIAIEEIENGKVNNLILLHSMMLRIEKTIHTAALESIKEINQKNENSKKMALEEDKLRFALKPVLWCLQLFPVKFTPQFLLIVKKILKVLLNCFNSKLIDLLLKKLKQVVDATSVSLVSSDFKLENTVGILSLFQNLKNSFFQHQRGSKEQIRVVIEAALILQNNFGNRYGNSQVKQQILKPIAKLLNIQMEFLSKMIIKERRLQHYYGGSSQGISAGISHQSNSAIALNGRIPNAQNTLSIATTTNPAQQNLGSSHQTVVLRGQQQGQQQANQLMLVSGGSTMSTSSNQNQMQRSMQESLYLKEDELELIYKVLKMDKSYDLRECLTREYQDNDFIGRFWDPNRSLQLQLKMIYLLSKNNTRVFAKPKSDSFEFLEKEYNKFRTESDRHLRMNHLKPFVTFAKLFILAFKRKKHNYKILFFLLRQFLTENVPCSFNFLKYFFQFELPSILASLDQKRKLLQYTFLRVIPSLISSPNLMNPSFDLNFIKICFTYIIKPIVKSIPREHIQLLYNGFDQDINYLFDSLLKRLLDRLFGVINSSASQVQQQNTGNNSNNPVVSSQPILLNSRGCDRFQLEVIILEMSRFLLKVTKDNPNNQQDSINKKNQLKQARILAEMSDSPIIKQLFNQLYIQPANKAFMAVNEFDHRVYLSRDLNKTYYIGDYDSSKTSCFFLQRLIINNLNSLVQYISLNNNTKQQSLQQLQVRNNIQMNNLQGSGITVAAHKQQLLDELMKGCSYGEDDKKKLLSNGIITYQEGLFEYRQSIFKLIYMELDQFHSKQQENYMEQRRLLISAQNFHFEKTQELASLMDTKANKNQEYNQVICNLICVFINWSFRHLKQEYQTIESKQNQQNKADFEEKLNRLSNKLKEFLDQKTKILYQQTEFLHQNTQSEKQLDQTSATNSNQMDIEENTGRANLPSDQQNPCDERLEKLNKEISECERQLQFHQNNQPKDVKFSQKELTTLQWNILEGYMNAHQAGFTAQRATQAVMANNNGNNRDKDFGAIVIELIIIQIFDCFHSQDDKIDRLLVLLKKSLILWRETEINYKLLLEKFSIQLIQNDQQELKLQQNNNIKCYSIILNVLSICLEFSTFNRIVESLPFIFDILKWSIMEYKQYQNADKREWQSIMNEEDNTIILKTANVFAVILEVCESDKHARNSKQLMDNICDMLQKNLDVHYELLLSANKRGVAVEYRQRLDQYKKTMSMNLIVKILLLMKNPHEKIKLNFNQVSQLIDNYWIQVQESKSQWGKFTFENFFIPKAVGYLPHNSSLYHPIRQRSPSELLEQYLGQTILPIPINQDIIVDESTINQSERIKDNQIYIKREGGLATTAADIDYAYLYREEQLFSYREVQQKKGENIKEVYLRYSLMYTFPALLQLFFQCISAQSTTKIRDIEVNFEPVLKVVRILLAMIDSNIVYSMKLEALSFLRALFLGNKVDGISSNIPVAPRFTSIRPLSQILEIKNEDILRLAFKDVTTRFRKLSFNLNSISGELALLDMPNISNSYRKADENIQFHFFKFLVELLKQQVTPLKDIQNHDLRKYLIMFSKTPASPFLKQFFEMIDSKEHLNELNTIFLILGCAKYESVSPNKKAPQTNTEIIGTHLTEDEGGMYHYENDDVYLFAYKFLLYKIKQASKNVSFVMEGTPNILYKARINFPQMQSAGELGNSNVENMINNNSSSSSNTQFRRQLLQEILELNEEIYEFDKKKQLNWLLECHEDMLLSGAKTTTICNDCRQYEDIRYIILSEEGVSKITPINTALMHTGFTSVMSYWLDLCSSHSARVLQLQTIEEYLTTISSSYYNVYGDKAYSIPPCVPQEDRRISRNWSNALFQILLSELFKHPLTNPYIINSQRIIHLAKVHHCFDLAQVYLEKLCSLMRDKKIEYSAEPFEAIQNLFEHLGYKDEALGVISFLSRDNNILTATAQIHQRNYQAAKRRLTNSISEFEKQDNPSSESKCNDGNNQANGQSLIQDWENLLSYEQNFSEYCQDYESLREIASYRELLIETQKGLGEWDSLMRFGKSIFEQNSNLVLEAKYSTIIDNFEGTVYLLDKAKEANKESPIILAPPSNSGNLMSQFSQLQQATQQQYYHFNYRHQQVRLLSLFHRRMEYTEILEEIYRATIQISYEWSALPKTVTPAQLSLISSFQSIIEFEEINTLLFKLKAYQEEKTMLLFFDCAQHMVELWRERMPHKYNRIDDLRMITNQRRFLYKILRECLRRKIILPQQNLEKAQRAIHQLDDSDWNALQYYKNYGVSNNTHALVDEGILYSTEAEYLRLKCVMNNALLEENTSKYDNIISRLKTQFNIGIQSRIQENKQDPEGIYQEYRDRISLKETQLLFKKKKYFECMMNMSALTKCPSILCKTAFLYVEVCYHMLESKQQHRDYYQKLLLIFLPEALKYKPYHSRLFAVLLFCLFEPCAEAANKDEYMRSCFQFCRDNIPSQALVLWTPKILQLLFQSEPPISNFNQYQAQQLSSAQNKEIQQKKLECNVIQQEIQPIQQTITQLELEKASLDIYLKKSQSYIQQQQEYFQKSLQSISNEIFQLNQQKNQAQSNFSQNQQQITQINQQLQQSQYNNTNANNNANPSQLQQQQQLQILNQTQYEIKGRLQEFNNQQQNKELQKQKINENLQQLQRKQLQSSTENLKLKEIEEQLANLQPKLQQLKESWQSLQQSIQLLQNALPSTGESVRVVFLRKAIESLKNHEQHLYLSLRPFLQVQYSQETGKWFQSIFENLKQSENASNTCKKLEYVLKCIFKPFMLPSSLSEHNLSSLDLVLIELNSLLDTLSSLESEQAYNQLLPQVVKQLKVIASTFPQINQLNIAAQQSSNSNITLPQLLQIIRTLVLAPIIQLFNKIQHNQQMSYSIRELLSFSMEASEVQIPGQYVQKTPGIFIEFKDHILMTSLVKDIQVELAYRQISKKILINASNFKQYAYEIQYEPEDQGVEYNNKIPRWLYKENSILKSQFLSTLEECLNSELNVQRECSSRGLTISQCFKLPIQTAKGFTSFFKSSSLTLNSLQNVHDWYLQSQTSSKNLQYFDKFNVHLDNYDGSNGGFINYEMKQLISEDALSQYVLSKCCTYQQYINLRRAFTHNYAAAAFKSYILGQTPSLSQISFDYVTGSVIVSTNNLEIKKGKVIHRNPHAIRLSRSIVNFMGQIGIYGIFAPSIIAIAKAVTEKELPFRLILSTLFNDLMQINGFTSEEEVKAQREQFFSKIYWLYSKEYKNLANMKGTEISSRIYSILDVYEETQLQDGLSISHKYWF